MLYACTPVVGPLAQQPSSATTIFQTKVTVQNVIQPDSHVDSVHASTSNVPSALHELSSDRKQPFPSPLSPLRSQNYSSNPIPTQPPSLTYHRSTQTKLPGVYDKRDCLKDRFSLKNYKEGITLSWRRLNCVVGTENSIKHVLRNLNGIAKPGQLLAIMGGSGAGSKFTLSSQPPNLLFCRQFIMVLCGHCFC